MVDEKMKQLKLVFITSSLGTKWESYSQALISFGFPTSKRVIIDGTSGWAPLNFLDVALQEESDYTIHIDEDCFLYDPLQLRSLIIYLDESNDVVLAGTPDGGTYYREHNPYACNLFFVVFKTRIIKSLIDSHPAWMNYSFRNDFRTMVDLDTSSLDQSRIFYDDFESYYPFFWLIIENGYKIHYLHSELNQELLSSDVRMHYEKMPLVRHMWYLRSWFSATNGPTSDMPNRQRYDRLEQELNHKLRSNSKLQRIYLRCNMLRLIHKGLRRPSAVFKWLKRR